MPPLAEIAVPFEYAIPYSLDEKEILVVDAEEEAVLPVGCCWFLLSARVVGRVV